MMECSPDPEATSSILMRLPAQDNDVMSSRANIIIINNHNNNNNSSSTAFLYGDSAQSLVPPVIVETGADSPTSNCLSPPLSDFGSTVDVSSSTSNHNNSSTLQNSTVICNNGQGRPSVVLESVSGQGRFAEVQGRESGSFSWLTAAVARSEEVGSCLGEKRHSRHSHASTGSTSSESSSAGRRARRLVKKVTSMTPGTHWRRLRNTLKAAQEMQMHKKKQVLSREDSFLRKFSTRNQRLQSQVLQLNDDADTGGFGGIFHRNSSSPRAFKPPRHFAVQHDGNFMFKWLGVVTLAVLYNLWTCILRQAFREVQNSCTACWITIDVLCDLVYLLDILVQFRTGYLNQGLMVYDSKKLAARYIRSKLLYVDAVCLCPLDFVQLYIGLHPMIRFPRFLKVYRTFRFLHMLESRTAYPNLIRVANLTHILFLGAHWFAAFYYMISEAEDFKGKWSYPRPEGEYAYVSRKYLASLFWSTLTLTTIGDLPPPENGKDYGMSNSAYVFVIVSYLLGVFVFATIVGQVGNVINNRNASRQEFERLLDGAKVYMQTHNVPSDLQKRVQRWYDYVWSRGRLNGCDINSLGLLPDKLKTELAIHVNLETLKKVTIFQECQPEFLHDLVLKMKAYIFTPGDLICRRGEVAREMFIIADGVVEIISENGTILKQMGAGDFFGEIGILNLDGGINRRTADVRSVGYSELFVLSRDDVLGALKDHPDAESIIRDYGQRRLREIEAHRQKVKPLKQMGAMAQLPTANSRNRVSMRPPTTNTSTTATITARCTSPTQATPGSSAKACPGGKTPDRYAHTCTGPGGKTYTYCYTGDDVDSQISPSPETSGRFHSFFSTVRQIFHRKVRRQKQDDDSETGCGVVSRFPWASCENRVIRGGRIVCLCCSNGSDITDDGESPSRSTGPELCIPQRVTQLLHSSPGGCYAPVLSEDDDCNQCASPQSPGPQSVSTTSGTKSKPSLATGDFRPDVTSKATKSATDKQTVVEMNYVKGADRVVEAKACRVLSPSCNHPDSKIHESCTDNDGRSASLDRKPLELGRAEMKAPETFSVNQADTPLEALNNDKDTQDQCAASDGQIAVRTLENFPSSSSGTRHSEKENGILNKCASCEDLKLTPAGKPTIRVDSASTLESADSADLGINCKHSERSCSDSSADKVLTAYSSNYASTKSRKRYFLHPGYPCLSTISSNELTHEDNDSDDRPCRCRSHSAPDIFMQECSKTLAQHKPTEGATSLPSSGTAVDVGFLVAPPSSRRSNYTQSATGRLLPWSKPAAATTTQLLPTRDVCIDQENIAGQLFQLQTSHDQLHMRMKELEEAYLTNIRMLEKLKEAQTDLLILLTDSLHSTQQRPKTRSRSKSCHSATFQHEGDMSAL